MKHGLFKAVLLIGLLGSSSNLLADKYVAKFPLDGVKAAPTFGMTIEAKEEHLDNVNMCKEESAGGGQFYDYPDTYVNVNMKKNNYGEWKKTVSFFWNGDKVSDYHYDQGDFVENGVGIVGQLSNKRYYIIPNNETSNYSWCVENGYDTSN